MVLYNLYILLAGYSLGYRFQYYIHYKIFLLLADLCVYILLYSQNDSYHSLSLVSTIH